MAETEQHEIVVIKRHGSHDDEHHGGAWKIAFADFMTAMMALFLVLWLISSTSDKTKQAVAQYFNPVKLVDVTTLKKGFRDPKKTELGAGASHAEPKTNGDGDHEPVETAAAERSDAKSRTPTDAAMFKDPYSALAEIAASGKEGTPRAAGDDNERSDAGSADASDVFSDPFTTVPRVAKSLDAHDAPDRRNAPRSTDGVNAVGGEAAQAAPKSETRSAHVARPGAVPAKTDANDRTATYEREAEQMKADVDKKIRAQTPGHGPGVEVASTPEGVLISLTDDPDFAMFRVGSARPEPETVKIMGVIGEMLKARPGKIVVRGHTDGRPFRSADYDNWRLSAARAQMAAYMLARGGLDEKRLERIESYADRHLKAPNDPFAPVNRRIEILLRKEK
ncbi:MotB family protein [Methylocella sp.]|uniref:MotB family protein n=1 Tax=Methylocella sp. TaxID=1978226 RepID=UPI003783136F